MLERHVRSSKAAFAGYKLLYYIIVTAWGYLLLKDAHFMPRALGGSGDATQIWKDQPYPAVMIKVR